MVAKDPLIGRDLAHVLSDGLRQLEHKQVLVTGGAGFLGSWLCDALVSSGAHVTCVDNLSTQGSMKSVEHLLTNRRFEFLRRDIAHWKPTMGYDFIIHAASIPTPEQYMAEPVRSLVPNSVAIHNLLEFSRKTEATFLYTSTSEIYGDATEVPTPESYVGCLSTTSPRASYYESKRYGETTCLAYNKQYGIDIRIARIFNTYGPRLDGSSGYSRVVSRFVVQALNNKPLTVHGIGKQTRSFCYVTDTISGLLRLLTIESLSGSVLNIGNVEEIEIIKLARKIIRLADSKSKISYEPNRPDDPVRRCPDISAAKRLLKWKPKVTLDDGLGRTVQWFKRRISSSF